LTGPTGPSGPVGTSAIAVFGLGNQNVAHNNTACISYATGNHQAPCLSSGFASDNNFLEFGPMPTGGVTIAHLSAVAAVSTSATITVLDNGSPTALSCAISAGTTCTDDTHAVAIAAGHFLEVQIQATGTNDTSYVASFAY
jgi:hypothetical protein